MEETRRSLLAQDLVRGFTFAELHCTLLLRHLQAGLLQVPKIPGMDSEEANLNAFAQYTDDLSMIEMKAALRSAALVFDQIANRPEEQRCGNRVADCIDWLEAVKARLVRSRRWLEHIAEHGYEGPLAAHNWDKESVGIAVREVGDTEGVQKRLILQ